MIPKIVHQTWYDHHLPKIYESIHVHNLQLNPEYVFRIYDEKEMENVMNDMDLPLIVKNAFLRLNPHYGPARSDLFRYSILYLYGGIYLDIKIKVLKSFDEWLDCNYDSFVYSHWKNHEKKSVLKNEKGECINWFLVFSKGHELLRHILLSICMEIMNQKNNSISGKSDVLSLTGPIAITKLLQNHFHQGREIIVQDFLDYGKQFFGIPIEGYTHYTKVYESIVLKSYFCEEQEHQIPIRFYPHFNIDKPGIYIGKNTHLTFLRPMQYLQNCDVMYMRDSIGNLIFLGCNSRFLQLKYGVKLLCLDNTDKIYFVQNILFKQYRSTNENRGRFHFMDHFELMTRDRTS